MQHDDPVPTGTEALERALRRALAVLTVLALVALAAASVRPSADPAPAGQADGLAPLPPMARSIDHSVVEPMALPDDSALVGASVAAYGS